MSMIPLLIALTWPLDASSLQLPERLVPRDVVTRVATSTTLAPPEDPDPDAEAPGEEPAETPSEAPAEQPAEPESATMTIVCFGECVVTAEDPSAPDAAQTLRMAPGEDASIQTLVVGAVPEGVDVETLGVVEPPAPECPEVTEDPEPEVVEFVEPPPACEPEPPPPPPPPRKRMLPRWAELTGLAAGVAVIASGASLWSVDGKCRPLGEELRDCPRLWESTAAGASLVGIGAAVVITSTVLLIVDETRTGKRGQERRVVKLEPTGVLRF